MNYKAINYLNNLHRRSIRLKGYDYSQAGLYFITICCQGKACLFGEVVKGKIVLYNSGSMISKWYFELENKFTDIRCHEMIVMPNHFHCIIENVSVGADLRVCPDSIPNERYKDVNNPHANYTKGEHTHGNYTKGEHTGSPLHQVLQWFKTMTTNE
jgi:putative transposase